MQSNTIIIEYFNLLEGLRFCNEFLKGLRFYNNFFKVKDKSHNFEQVNYSIV